MKRIGLSKTNYSLIELIVLLTLMLIAPLSFASQGSQTLGNVATTITGSFTSLAKLITACSYLGGLAFAIGAIMKFKQHKDNPNQIPIGTPISLVLIAAALLFLPSILGVTGYSMFGSSAATAGAGGIYDIPGVTVPSSSS